jgi:hypothetical protein
MRASLAALALIALTAGCGSATSPSKRGAPAPGSLQALWNQSGESVGLIPGTTDYSPGDLRISFLVVDHRGRVVAPAKARFWIARSLHGKPFGQTVARLENVGVPGVTTSEPVKALYVAHVRVPSPGTYWVLARPLGSVRIGGVTQVVVNERSTSPAVGTRAFPSHTPTLVSAHGRTAELTTRVPPDRGLLRYSIAESLAAHAPFVVTFATPRWCSSRTCGPVVDVVDAARRQLRSSPVRFIHVEVYAGNDPRKGYNRWYRQWHLRSEPWTFLVGADGRVKAKLAGSMSLRELAAAVRRFLL